ncbi:hypothetical protein LEMLEM_LOCUS25010 [Lemmus lemmus]
MLMAIGVVYILKLITASMDIAMTSSEAQYTWSELGTAMLGGCRRKISNLKAEWDTLQLQPENLSENMEKGQ